MTQIVRLDEFAKSQAILRQDAWRGSMRAMTEVVPTQRHSEYSVFWLKENYEYLHALQAMQGADAHDFMMDYAPFYTSASAWLEDFPQYYRFILGMVKCLEPALQGGQYRTLCDQVRQKSMASTELNDVQRAEALYLLQEEDPHLQQRLLDYGRNAAFFAVPNKTACYYLTHIVFYETHYGARVTDTMCHYKTALIYAGCFAYLDQNIDLLAEISLALTFIQEKVPSLWRERLSSISFDYSSIDPATVMVDDYHTYLMARWAQSSLEHVPLQFDLSMHKACVTMVRSERSHIHALWAMSTLYRDQAGADPNCADPIFADQNFDGAGWLSHALRQNGGHATARVLEALRAQVSETAEFLDHFMRRPQNRLQV